MKNHVMVFMAGLLIVAGLLLYTVTYQVGSNEIVLLKTFGATTAVARGSEPGQAGLRFKLPWPVQRVVKYDAGTFILDDALAELPLKDKQNVMLSTFAAWKIADADKFNRTLVSVTSGEKMIRDILQSEKGNQVAMRTMSDLVNTDPKLMQLGEIESAIRARAGDKLKNDYGIELVMLGTKALGLTENVSKAVVEAQKTEAELKIKNYEAQANASANAIRERAESAKRQIVDFADRKAAMIRAEGTLASNKYYQLFKDAPKLSIFLRTLDTMRKTLTSRTVMLIDENSQFPGADLFKNGAVTAQWLPSAEKAKLAASTTQPAGSARPVGKAATKSGPAGNE